MGCLKDVTLVDFGASELACSPQEIVTIESRLPCYLGVIACMHVSMCIFVDVYVYIRHTFI